MRINKLKNRISTFLIVLILLAATGLAANDPGHDTLYIEEEGDSEVNGSLNITHNMSIEGKTYQGAGLTLYGDGSTTSSGAYISGEFSTNHLYLGGPGGNIYLRPQGSQAVFVGITGAATDLNVSGALYVQSGTATVGGTAICLQNGTNCPGGNNTGNVTSVTAASGTPLTASPTTGDVIINITIPTCGGTDKLTYNGTDFKCETDEDSGGTGDITSVQTPGIYIYNGSNADDVYLRFNETKLNATIDARDTAGTDDQNLSEVLSQGNRGFTNQNLIITDGSICADNNGGTCAGSTDGYIYADDFVCNGGNCIGDTELTYNTGQHLNTTGTPTFGDLTINDDLFVNDFGRIDALRVGTTSTDPGDGNIYVENYALVLGGVHVGGTGDPGDDNLIVDGTINVDGTGTHDFEGTVNVDNLTCETAGCIGSLEISGLLSVDISGLQDEDLGGGGDDDFGAFTCTGEENGCTLDSTYDNYGDWNLYEDGTERDNITTGEDVGFDGNEGINVSWDGSRDIGIQFDCSEVDDASSIRCDGEDIEAYALSAADGSPNSAVYVDDGGQVGINNTAPDAALHIQGGLCIDTDAACTDPGSGNTYAQGNIRATGDINTTTGDICIEGGNCLSNMGVGAGDITSVQTPGIYIYNGSNADDVYLRFNETKLNATIEVLSDIDTNTWWTIDLTDFINNSNTLELNWTTINNTIKSFNSTWNYTTDTDTHAAGDGIYLYNDSITITFNETKLNNTIANFNSTWNYTTDTTIGNCSGLGDCSNILYTDTNSLSNFTDNIGATWNNYTSGIGFNESGTTIQLNLARTGLDNLSATFTDTDTTYTANAPLFLSGTAFDLNLSGATYLYDNSGALNLNETKLNATINAIDTNLNGTTAGGNLSGTYPNPTVIDVTCTDCLGLTQIEDIYLRLSGDNTTGNYTFGSTTLHIDDTNYRIGIGTTSPTHELTVIGDANITGTVYAHNFSGNSNITFINGTGAEVMRITDTGNVGIGDTGPDAKLEVLANSGPQLMLTNTDAVDYANFTVDSDGNLTITPSGGSIIIKLG